jgi:ATPase subunit of ABC transporter with duplicated ATPase domains
MLQLTKISKSYDLEPLFSQVSFVINQGERVSLVGPNGCGKTTLLRLIVGLEQPDEGSITFNPPNLAVGYLPQALPFEPEETVGAVLSRDLADYYQAQTEMQHYAELMAASSDEGQLTDLMAAYAQAEARFEAAGGYDLEIRLEKVLAGLGLVEVSRDLPVAYLSGGQKTRLGLAGLLLRQPRLLLLDEPTNHLDIDALTWLEAWLGDYDGAVLLISHDRAFLDATTTRTLVIDPSTQTLRDIPGNYSEYLATLSREVDQQWQVYQDQQQEISHLRQTAQHLRGQAKFRRGGKADQRDKFAKAHFANRSSGTMGRAKQIERRLEQLQEEGRVDKPPRHWQLKVDFAHDASGARQVLSLEDVEMAFDKQVLFSQVNLTVTNGQRVALIGPNGEGKTTLLRLIAGELQPTAGRIHLGPGLKLGYMAQEQEILDLDSTPYDTIAAVLVEQGRTQGEIRQFLHQFLFAGDEVFVKIGYLSLGERVRLMLALLVAQACNFLLMDEPLNHLDIQSRERFEQALLQFPGTVMAVVHDRAFIERFATDVWEIRAKKLRFR